MYYFMIGAGYAVIWLIYNEAHVNEETRAFDEELESEHVDDKRFPHFVFTAVMFATITALWPVRLYRDFYERKI